MKQLITALLIAMMGTLSAQDMLVDFQPESTSWEKVQAMAQEQGKFIFVDAYTEWCGWCKVQDRNTFTDEEVAEFLNNNFVSIKYDFERGTGRLLAMKHRVQGYPTILFFSPEGTLVGRHVGYEADKAKFVQICDEAMRPENFAPVVGDPKVLEPEFPKFYLAAFGPNGERTYPKSEEVASWLGAQEDLFNEVAYNVLMTMPLGDNWSAYLLEQSAAYADRYGQADIQDKVMNLIGRKAYAAAKEGNQETFEEALALTDQYLVDQDVTDFKLSLRLTYHEQQEEWDQYALLGMKVAEMQNYENPGMLNSLAWTLYLKDDNPETLLLAANWMSRVVSDHPDDYSYLDTYAAVLYKSGNYEQALKWTDKALAVGKAAGEEVEETEALRKKIVKALQR